MCTIDKTSGVYCTFVGGRMIILIIMPLLQSTIRFPIWTECGKNRFELSACKSGRLKNRLNLQQFHTWATNTLVSDNMQILNLCLHSGVAAKRYACMTLGAPVEALKHPFGTKNIILSHTRFDLIFSIKASYHKSMDLIRQLLRISLKYF